MDKKQLVSKSLTVLQVLPSLESGGVERGTLEVGQYLTEKGHRSLVMSAGGRLVSKLEQEGSEHRRSQSGRREYKSESSEYRYGQEVFESCAGRFPNANATLQTYAEAYGQQPSF